MPLTKCLKFISGQKAQTTLEYFIILAVMALVTFTLLHNMLPQIRTGLSGSDNTMVTENSFFGQAIKAIGVGY
ncbi:MAG: hypothetical protein NC923_04550 [Candidatus Omnitrophica bacterium]|nr:hypothetical protein [Candidatus Omnitrophota bacterium]